MPQEGVVLLTLKNLNLSFFFFFLFFSFVSVCLNKIDLRQCPCQNFSTQTRLPVVYIDFFFFSKKRNSTSCFSIKDNSTFYKEAYILSSVRSYIQKIQLIYLIIFIKYKYQLFNEFNYYYFLYKCNRLEYDLHYSLKNGKLF